MEPSTNSIVSITYRATSPGVQDQPEVKVLWRLTHGDRGFVLRTRLEDPLDGIFDAFYPRFLMFGQRVAQRQTVLSLHDNDAFCGFADSGAGSRRVDIRTEMELALGVVRIVRCVCARWRRCVAGFKSLHKDK